MEKLNILVIEDSAVHQQAAREQLADHNLTVVGSYDEGQEWLTPYGDLYCKKAREFRKGGMNDDDASAQALQLFKWDVVLIDLMLPASRQALSDEHRHLAGQEMPIGTTLAFLALKQGVKRVAVVTDTNHHHNPASAALDVMCSSFSIGDARMYMTNSWSHEHYGSAKPWGSVLTVLLNPEDGHSL